MTLMIAVLSAKNTWNDTGHVHPATARFKMLGIREKGTTIRVQWIKAPCRS